MQPLSVPARDSASTLAGRPFRRMALIALVALLAAALVPASRTSAAAQQEYGPYSDGCYWTSDGTNWVEKRCPQNDGSNYHFLPDENGEWAYSGQCSVTTYFTACLLYPSGTYVELYNDGSQYYEGSSRQYAILHTDGTRAEAGYYDAYGMQKVYNGQSTTKNSMAMRNRSLTYWYYLGWAIQTVVNSNPRVFGGLITMNQASNEYVNCLHLNNSSIDFDSDTYTGFNELAEYCTEQAFG